MACNRLNISVFISEVNVSWRFRNGFIFACASRPLKLINAQLHFIGRTTHPVIAKVCFHVVRYSCVLGTISWTWFARSDVTNISFSSTYITIIRQKATNVIAVVKVEQMFLERTKLINGDEMIIQNGLELELPYLVPW